MKKHMLIVIWLAVVLQLFTVTKNVWGLILSGVYMDVWASSNENIYIATLFDGILHYDGIDVTTSLGREFAFLSIWGSSDSDIYASGYSDIMYHYNGTSWTETGIPLGDYIFGVWGFSGTDIFAVGSEGSIQHFDGIVWSPMISPTALNLNHVWGASPADVFAVGDNGTIIHYDGSSWSQMNSGVSCHLQCVYGSSSSDVYAVGYSGCMLHYDGTDWSSENSWPPNYDFHAIWGDSHSNFFVAGDYDSSSAAVLLNYDGSFWSALDTQGASTLRGICGTPEGDVFVVGPNVIIHLEPEPTLIELSFFFALPGSRQMLLSWRTASETDNAGFNIHRAESEDGEYIQINHALIPAEGSATEGAVYEFIDNDVQNRKTYWYKLEDIDLNGVSTMHGPVKATPRLIHGLGK